MQQKVHQNIFSSIPELNKYTTKIIKVFGGDAEAKMVYYREDKFDSYTMIPTTERYLHLGIRKSGFPNWTTIPLYRNNRRNNSNFGKDIVYFLKQIENENLADEKDALISCMEEQISFLDMPIGYGNDYLLFFILECDYYNASKVPWFDVGKYDLDGTEDILNA